MNKVEIGNATPWQECYADGWKGEIVLEAFAHPAKVSRALIRRIYEHAFAESWLRAGDTVCDPFGGIAGTALDAMWNGLIWVGVELESRFCGLAQQNLDLWRRKYGSKPGFGSARILQGDSRQLASVIQSMVDCVVSSPPYAGDSGKSDRTGHERAERRAEEKGFRQGLGCFKTSEAYGNSEGQLGAMPEGKFDAVVSSPPYAELRTDGGKIAKEGVGGMRPYSDDPIDAWRTTRDQSNLGNMPEGRFDACIGSPPFESGSEGVMRSSKFKDAEAFARKQMAKGHGCSFDAKMKAMQADDERHAYGNAAGNIGNQSGDTFWQAAREIVSQCHAILRPGGHVIWICKDFVRKGKRVPFSDQWQALCESQGFQLVCRHQAMLVAHHGEQDDLFGDTKQIKTERKSFFRRLAEKNGSPPINWEDVICLVRL